MYPRVLAALAAIFAIVVLSGTAEARKYRADTEQSDDDDQDRPRRSAKRKSSDDDQAESRSSKRKQHAARRNDDGDDDSSKRRSAKRKSSDDDQSDNRSSKNKQRASRRNDDGDDDSGKRHSGVGPRPGAWCGWYMRTRHGGGPEMNVAANWRNYGRSGSPQVGAIVVWPHHVGEIVGRHSNGQWIVLSGNDSNAVRRRPRSISGATIRV